MSRRGSLSISTNAIVVLIVAVVMLGLIMGLVTKGFGAVERKFLDEIKNEQEPQNPSTSNPITISSTTKTAERGSLTGFKVKILNIDSATVDSNQEPLYPIRPTIRCVDDTVQYNPQYSPQGNDVTRKEITSHESNIIEIDNDDKLPVSQVFKKELGFNQVGDYIFDFRISNSAMPGTYLCEVSAVAIKDNDEVFVTEMKPAEFRLDIEG